jgi:septum formation protein
MLRQAGLDFTVEAAAVDEDEVKRALRVEGADAGRAAEMLAELKAMHVSGRRPGALVIGADQILDCNGAWFDKPADRATARRDLAILRGRDHQQITAACVVRDGVLIWHTTQRARLTMRDFSDDFLDRYLDAAGGGILGCAGGYQLEGVGVQLFSRVDGDYFAILGLPLLPLLDFLRGHRVIAP